MNLYIIRRQSARGSLEALQSAGTKSASRSAMKRCPTRSGGSAVTSSRSRTAASARSALQSIDDGIAPRTCSARWHARRHHLTSPRYTDCAPRPGIETDHLGPRCPLIWGGNTLRRGRPSSVLRFQIHVLAAAIAASLIGSAGGRAPSFGRRATPRTHKAGVAGRPVDCIQLKRVGDSSIVDKTAIIFAVGDVLYVNKPASAGMRCRTRRCCYCAWASQLCSGQAVRLFRSTPITVGFELLQAFGPLSEGSRQAGCRLPTYRRKRVADRRAIDDGRRYSLEGLGWRDDRTLGGGSTRRLCLCRAGRNRP